LLSCPKWSCVHAKWLTIVENPILFDFLVLRPFWINFYFCLVLLIIILHLHFLLLILLYLDWFLIKFTNFQFLWFSISRLHHKVFPSTFWLRIRPLLPKWRLGDSMLKTNIKVIKFILYCLHQVIKAWHSFVYLSIFILVVGSWFLYSSPLFELMYFNSAN